MTRPPRSAEKIVRDLVDFAVGCMAEEREACAQIAYDYVVRIQHSSGMSVRRQHAGTVANKIRARENPADLRKQLDEARRERDEMRQALDKTQELLQAYKSQKNRTLSEAHAAMDAYAATASKLREALRELQRSPLIRNAPKLLGIVDAALTVDLRKLKPRKTRITVIGKGERRYE